MFKKNQKSKVDDIRFEPMVKITAKCKTTKVWISDLEAGACCLYILQMAQGDTVCKTAS